MSEYLFYVGDSIFRVYEHNEKLATSCFISTCEYYAKSGSQENKDYWEKMKDTALKKDHMIIKSEDFLGVRRIF